MNTTTFSAHEDCGLPEQWNSKAGQLHAEAEFHWDVAMGVSEDLLRLGVKVRHRDLPDENGRSVSFQSDDGLLGKVATLAFDYAIALITQRELNEDVTQVLKRAPRTARVNATKKKEADQCRLGVADAYVSWAESGGFDEGEFAKAQSHQCGGPIERSASRIRAILKSLRRPLEQTAAELFRAGLSERQVAAQVFSRYQGSPGVSRATVGLAVSRVRGQVQRTS
jgi:hypothetical protein